MRNFLLVYRRASGDLVQFCDFGTDREAAIAERATRERQLSADADVEVVVLSAESEQELRQTHSRYFNSVPELAGRLGDALSATR